MAGARICIYSLLGSNVLLSLDPQLPARRDMLGDIRMRHVPFSVRCVTYSSQQTGRISAAVFLEGEGESHALGKTFIEVNCSPPRWTPLTLISNKLLVTPLGTEPLFSDSQLLPLLSGVDFPYPLRGAACAHLGAGVNI